MRRLMVVVPIVLTLSLSALACGGESPEDVAVEVARDWTIASLQSVTVALADFLLGEVPAAKNFTAGRLAEVLRNELEWDFSTPVKKAEDIYMVAVQTTAEVGLGSFSEDNYAVSAVFDVEVDTSKAEVADWKLGPSSLSARKN